MKLSREQIEFLEHHRIDEDDLFDASGLSRQYYQIKMEQQNKIIAFGVDPCQFGHTLKTRAGHCPQCNTATIAFMKRHVAPGIVYIAGSLKGNLIKIGSAKNKNARTDSLNKSNYGGYNDWVILCTATCNDSGKNEFEVSRLLTKYGISKYYNHDGGTQEAYELFSCSYETAIHAMRRIQSEGGGRIFKSILEVKTQIPKYSFRNLVKRAVY